MARPVKIDGIVLKRFDLGEADRVLTIFTKELGKVSVIAKGVRRLKSRRAGSVEVCNHIQALIFPGSSFYVLNEVSLQNSFISLKKSLPLLSYAYHILEITDRLTVEGEEHTEVFGLIILALSYLDASPRQIYVRTFEVKLLQALGFLNVEQIGVSGEFAGSEFLDEFSVEILLRLASYRWEQIGQLELNEEIAFRLEQFLKFRLERVMEKPLRSRSLLT